MPVEAEDVQAIVDARVSDLEILVRQLQSVMPVRGTVTVSGGAITGVVGTGFTAVRNAAGDYSIVFTTAFPTAPEVNVTPTQTGGPTLTARTGSKSTGGFSVAIYSTATQTDSSFDFTAYPT